jgi:hypothetical protein
MAEDLYESPQDEIAETMQVYEDLVIKLKSMADNGDMNARCLHDIFVLTYECLTNEKILDLRNDIVGIYKKIIVPRDVCVEEELKIKQDPDMKIN